MDKFGIYSVYKEFIRTVGLLIKSNNIHIFRKKPPEFKISHLKLIKFHIKSQRNIFVYSLLFSFIISLLALPTPYLMKYVIDSVLQRKNIKLLHMIFAVLVVILLLKLFITFFSEFLHNFFSQTILAKIRKNLYSHLLRLPLPFFEKNESGYLVSRFKETEDLEFFFSFSFFQIIASIFEFILCYVVLFQLSWKLTIITLFIFPIYFLVNKFHSFGIKKAHAEGKEKEATIYKKIQEILSGIEVVKLYSRADKELAKLNVDLNLLKSTLLKKNLNLNISSELISVVGALSGLIIFWVSGLEIISGNFSIGSYFAFSAYLNRLYGPTRMLAVTGLQIQPALSALERINELMNVEQEEDKKIRLRTLRGEIEFRNVFFSYNETPFLKNLNFKINEKEKVLITGPNGSGKSTVIKLILGLYKYQMGEILIDNFNINHLSLSSLRKHISVISQNTFLFNDTIKNNILYSKPKANEAELENAVKLSGLYDFIMNLSGGFETIVGERGVALSGGELQKISIARAILKESKVIIMDEATTHLDKKSKQLIESLINKHFYDKTCIIISHGNLNLLNIDRILALKAGKIIEKKLN